jgi:predicted outer membrane repeat protein
MSGSGSFITMSDNATVSGNTAYVGGGGVYAGGSFTMSDNATVSGNTTTSSGGPGGGVCALGSFTKTGGVIYGSNETDPVLRNTVKNSAGVEQTDRGAAVYGGNSFHQRETTVGVTQNLSKTSSGTYTGQWTD